MKTFIYDDFTIDVESVEIDFSQNYNYPTITLYSKDYYYTFIVEKISPLYYLIGTSESDPKIILWPETNKINKLLYNFLFDLIVKF